MRTNAPLAIALSVGLALPAVAAEPVGPPIGKNSYKAHISDGPQGDDVDDYVVALFAGERLSVRLKVPFGSGLAPHLTLLDPDQDDRSAEAGLPANPIKRSIRLAPFTVDETGVWAVRVAGLRDSQGAYTVRFSINTPRKRTQKGIEIGGTQPETTDFPIEAADGSTLDVTVKTRGRGTLALPVGLSGPDGEQVPGAGETTFTDAVRKKKHAAIIKGFTLTGGSGTYVLTVGAGGDAATYDLTYRVRPPERARGAQKLSPIEPFLTPPDNGPLRGILGTRVRLQGWNFSAGELPTVSFGHRTGVEVLVDPSGGFLDVTAPQPERMGPVAVSVSNPDGQATTQDDYFFYVPPPVLAAVTDVDGDPLLGDSTDGGRRVRLVGDDFATGQLVRFGRQGTSAIPFLHSDKVMDVTVPPGAAGIDKVIVYDTFGQQAESPSDFEYKPLPTFTASPYSPVVSTAGATTPIRVTGTGFETTDMVLLDGAPVPSSWGSNQIFVFTAPAIADGSYTIEVLDRLGLRAQAPNLRVKAPGIIDTVTAIAGPQLGGVEISQYGGATVRIAGRQLHEGDTVTIGGVSATVSSASTSSVFVVAPAGTHGTADVVVTDVLDQTTTASAAIRYAGAADTTATRSPGATSTDDLSGVRAVAGDLDGDGDDDDLALLSNGTSPGTRAERLRVFLGDGDGVLVDDTADAVPGAGSDTTATDDWHGAALALGDVDGGSGNDLLLAGPSPDPDSVSELRLFANDGSGAFSLEEGDAPASLYLAGLVAEDEAGDTHTVFGARGVDGVATCLALGDVDGDGDLDVVLGRSHHLSVAFSIDPAAVDTGVDPAYISAADAVTYALAETRYSPAARLLENRIADGDGFVDVTATGFPSAGKDTDAAPSPALVARDLAFSDLDGDMDVDLVITWDDPRTTTPKGLDGTDVPRVATRVLVNDGNGVFTDATSSWLTSGVAPEFFQADRLVLVDLDGDGDDDLVLVHSSSVNAYLGVPPGGNRHALRVLRNDGNPAAGGAGFTDVTASVLPRVPLAGNDNLRGDALAVRDITGDGAPDILVGARTQPTDGGTALRALRLLTGTAATIAFEESSGFLVPHATDTGQCDDVVLVPDLPGSGPPAIVLISETAPATSPSGATLRIADWQR